MTCREGTAKMVCRIYRCMFLTAVCAEAVLSLQAQGNCGH